jgi:GTPase SAR1 family protein
LYVIDVHNYVYNNSYYYYLVGQERYQSITQRFYYNTSAVMIVYDIADAESYNEATRNWFHEASTYLDSDQSDRAPIILVGNKSDLEEKRAIQFKEVKEFSSRHNLLTPVECSAKKGGDKVRKAFESLCKEIVHRNTKYTKEQSVAPRVTNVSSKCC